MTEIDTEKSLHTTNCLCKVKRVCWCGREIELWTIDGYWVEGCKSCNKIYTFYVKY